MKARISALLCFAALFLNSCLGVVTDISMRADGSGKISLEYRVSQALESIGRLDGNERWPAIPVGRPDFERSLARIPGLRLSSFSSKDQPAKSGTPGARDLVTRVTVEFKDTAALTAFLGSAAGGASLAKEGGNAPANLLRVTLLDPAESPANDDLLSLLREVSAGYEIGFSFSAPAEASLTVVPSSVSPASLVSQGKKVSFTMALADILALGEGLALEIRW
ncbi:MAG: hypothetical protein FWH38_02695 [Treponema sp.]|nr:hypothetical protein [Treponema sp.]